MKAFSSPCQFDHQCGQAHVLPDKTILDNIKLIIAREMESLSRRFDRLEKKLRHLEQ